MRARQRLLRDLVTDIITDVDETAREVVLTIHWRGGQHSQLRVRKPKSGEHSHPRRGSRRDAKHGHAMVGRRHRHVVEPDGNAHRSRKDLDRAPCQLLRRVHGIHAYRSAEKNGEWLTMAEAATQLGVTNHRIRRLIKDRVLAAEQVVPGAPYQIRPSDLQDERVIAAAARTDRPCRVDLENQLAMFTDT